MICSRKEFQDLCGISRANYNTYRDARGKIIEHEVDGSLLIDTDHPVNKAFYENRKQLLEKKRQDSIAEIAPAAKSIILKKEAKPAPSKKTKSTADNSKSPNFFTEKYELETEKTRAEIAFKLAQTALSEQKLATISGNNVPMPIVLQMFSELSRSLLTGYKDYSEQLLSKFCHKHKVIDPHKIDLIAEMITGLNNTHTKCVNSARSHMKNELKRSNIKESLFGEDVNEGQ